MADLPRIICPRYRFGAVTADLDQAPWPAIPSQTLHEIAHGGTPLQATRVRAAWSEHEWRVLFDCEDTQVWATLTERDAPLYQEETVEVFFDPVGDLRSYYEIEVNPLNTVLDLVLRKSRSGYRGDRSWDCEGLETRVRHTPHGWTAELAIPFAAVTDSVPSAGAQWRANFCRIDRPDRTPGTPRELTAWSPPGRLNFHTPERFGIVEFVVPP